VRLVRIAVTLLGLLALLVGILWIGQGTGYIPWPRTSFMIDQMPWAYAGAALGAAGLAAMFLAKRIR